MSEHNLFETLAESTTGPAQAESVGRLRTITWEDVVWMLILSGLATLWVMLLTSPSWR